MKQKAKESCKDSIVEVEIFAERHMTCRPNNGWPGHISFPRQESLITQIISPGDKIAGNA